MRKLSWFLVVVLLSACAKANPPLKLQQLSAQTPERGHAIVSGQKAEQVGEILPIGINVANGADKRYHIDPTQVFAVTSDGRRVVPVPLSEAIRLAGNEASLGAELKSGLATGLLGAAVGAGAGAAGGALGGNTTQGAAAGGALGGVVGAVGGAMAGREAALEATGSQLRAYALQDRDVEDGYSVTGYVFYPAGDYVAVEAMLRDEEGNPETVHGSLTQ